MVLLDQHTHPSRDTQDRQTSSPKSSSTATGVLVGGRAERFEKVDDPNPKAKRRKGEVALMSTGR
jgi:hypothetical protein